MDWIFDNFQIVALIAFAFASWIKHRFDAKNAEREEEQSRRELETGETFGPEEDWEPENEARPTQSVPPPLMRQSPPPLMREAPAPTNHMRQDEADAIMKRQQDLKDRLKLIKETKAKTSGGAAATRNRVAASQTNAKPLLAVKSGLRSAVRNPKEIRRAIVLKEILDPPMSLR
jgi:hypothetical protein